MTLEQRPDVGILVTINYNSMKKIILFLLVLVLAGCKTKEVVTSTEKTAQKENTETVLQVSQDSQTVVASEQRQTEVKELKELLSELNISYNGQNVDDKLGVLLSQTKQGMQLSISGTGSASFKETTKQEFEALQLFIIKRQDSLHNIQINALNQLKSELYAEFKIKDKDVKTKGFTVGFWITIILIVVGGVFLNGVYNWFRPYLKGG